MDNIKTKADELLVLMDKLLDDVFNQHRSLAQVRYFTPVVIHNTRTLISDAKVRLQGIRKLTEALIQLAPTKEVVARDNIKLIEDQITDYSQALRGVLTERDPLPVSTPPRYRSQVVLRYRPINDQLCQYARTILGQDPYREYLGHRIITRRVY